MGTRNLTLVQYNNEIKVAQYGQWDGYPAGAGTAILDFCSSNQNLNNLRNRLKNIRFLTDEEENDIYNTLSKLEDKRRKAKAKYNYYKPTKKEDYLEDYFDFYLTRDIGCNILNVINENVPYELIENDEDKIKLSNHFSFGYDSLFCEWAYLINLDTHELEVYCGFNKTDNDPESRWYIAEPKEDTEYFGVVLLKKYDMDDLPEKEDFVQELNDLEAEFYERREEDE